MYIIICSIFVRVADHYYRMVVVTAFMFLAGILLTYTEAVTEAQMLEVYLNIYNEHNNQSYVCSGAYINSRYILTTAHCVTYEASIFGVATRFTVDTNDIIIRAGLYGKCKTNDDYEKNFHECQESVAAGVAQGNDHNLAVITLSIPFVFPEPAIQLYTINETASNTGDRCRMWQWGKKEEVTIKNKSNNGLIIADNRRNQSQICYYDSGLPLVCGNKLAGIMTPILAEKPRDVCVIKKRLSFFDISTKETLQFINSIINAIKFNVNEKAIIIVENGTKKK